MSPKKKLEVEVPANHDQYIDDVFSSPDFVEGVLSYLYEIVEENRRLRYENSHDDLTGLFNKRAWKDIVEDRIEGGKPFGVIFVDLNAFKAINDTFGHQKGDEVLRNFSKHIASKFSRQEDAISHERLIGKQDEDKIPLGRIGGDEFGIIVDLGRVKDDGTTLEERMKREDDYTKEAVNEFVAQQPEEVRALHFGVSLGSAIWYPDNPVSSIELIHQADQAMYIAKTANNELAR
jgi:diguanylate cyclase (GGDEF)-like protein